ncbi:cysteine desulfurase [Paraburkholderia hospita]|uniref:Cysteine desulfurase n=1 Tax=Paraburkholderia hospita TaxID=169430 RepID=A0ABN0F747_9BURK|nr:cysteine desulfurase [Paraburkholderia hospita]SKD03919.1 L-selenocysteine selenide-lyase (L-alanine-forming) [Burkholderia sp. CF099]EIM94471.1 SufS subfamily cysteine desulfurase [Paraburkholderia hospita]OUL77040.1 aminotransferase [Paraburkholderia hospita]OUL80572.1 aminotransferase [Paraburkholderia hospita]SKD06785.1 L-selenocysteine selenide-lyase (L-alanine-forming) [Paraburkholderia hospita]
MKPIEQVWMPDPRNVVDWRADFPILGERVHDRPLVYLDNGATTQKPASVLDAEDAYYRHNNANVHRGVHLLSQRATDAFEAARARIARFINAQRPEEIVFVRGTTEAINLVAQSYARPHLKPGDEILISAMEHHSNIVPWQLVCEQTGAALKVVPIDDTGALDTDAYERLLNERTRLVAITHLANALGSINPVERIVVAAHAKGVPVLLDGAQAISHLPVDVRVIDCDFYAFSGHKVYGPTGIGALYARAALLEAMLPWQGGGDMIRSVTFEKTEYNAIPWKFEAGTPNIAGAIALGAALDYVDSIGMEVIAAHETDLLAYATDALGMIPGLRLIGTARDKASILSFVLDGVHAHDVGTILDHHGVAVRAGHHCAMPVMQRFGVPATVRASLALYNTHEDIDALIEGLGRVREIFGL